MNRSEMSVDTLVMGAGTGGLGAGCWLKDLHIPFIVVDRCKEVPKNLHNGVHYLHSIPRLPFDMEFKSVTLTDGIIELNGNHKPYVNHNPNLNHMLEYSEKVREVQHPSSIMEVGKKETVFLPKTNTLNEMIENMENYIGEDGFLLNHTLVHIDVVQKFADFEHNETKHPTRVAYKNCISTLPLDLIQPHFGFNLELKSNPVHICNIEVDKIVPNWMINLYVPDPSTPVYRISVLNNLASIESTHLMSDAEIAETIEWLGKLFHLKFETASAYTWQTGKVMSIPKDDRERIVKKMISNNFFSIGRFGLWNRKLLVDSTINQSGEVVSYLKGYTNIEQLTNSLI